MAVYINVNAQYTKLFDFNGTNGANPYNGDLFYDGTYLFGMTYYGGTHNKGVIFRIMPDGSAYDTLLNFNGPKGAYPWSSFISDGTYLYGMTNHGGANLGSSSGVIFKIKPDGTGFDTLMSFNNYSYGMNPIGNLLSDGNFLYGVAQSGGGNNNCMTNGAGDGTIFKIKPDGTNFDTVMVFGCNQGAVPISTLISDGTYLYGMTEQGGAFSDGNIFKVKTDGTGFDTLINFRTGVATNGLIRDGSYFYGMTNALIFKIKPDGTGYDTLMTFNGTNGSNPWGSLLSDGTYLYGMTSAGGAHDSGLVFKIKPDGTGFIDLFDFDGTSGAVPYGSLISDGTYLYGMTSSGGAYGEGVVFRFKNCTSPTPPIATYTLIADPTPHVWSAMPSISGGTAPYAYHWSWGDGSTTDTLYTSHTYTAASYYNICLTVVDGNGCSTQYCENDNLYRTSDNNAIIQINVVNSSNSINELDIHNSGFKIYPNPANTTIQVTANKEPLLDTRIYDVLGNKVLQSKQKEIDVSSLVNGVYFLQSGNSTQKFIVQH
jgi:uncharacterized repeat protein (TIGR03803 family)